MRRVSSRALRAASRAAAASTTLPTMDLASDGILLEPCGQRLVEHAFDHRAHFRRDQLVLRLRGEFGIRHLDGQHRGQAFAAIVAGERHLFLLGQAGGVGVAGDLPGQRAAKAGEMRAAVALRNVVGEAEHVLVVTVVPPQRRFHADTVALAAYDDGLGDEGRLGAIEITHEGLDAAIVLHLLDLALGVTIVGEHDAHAGIEEGEFTQAVLQGGVVELDHGEGARRGQERHLGAALAAGIADRRQRRHRVAVAKLDEVLLTVAPDAQLQPRRQRVHHGDADPVQAARDLVGVLIEFPASMQLGHDDLGGRHALRLVDAGRDAAAVVGNGAPSRPH